jgi:hypothetical protein
VEENEKEISLYNLLFLSLEKKKTKKIGREGFLPFPSFPK